MFGLEPLPRSLEAALRDAADPKERVRLSAVRDLAHHAGTEPSAVTALVERLGGDPAPEVRAAAALALADAEARDGLDALVAAAAEGHPRVRQMSLIALGELGPGTDPRIGEIVSAALDDAAPALRFQALIAASALGLGAAESALVAATEDTDGEVRHIALRLLEERATQDEVVPSQHVLAAARRRLDDGSLRVRLAAAILLARAGDRSGARVIVEGVAATNEAVDPDDEQAAVVLAGELALGDAVAGLERRAFNPLGFGRHFAFEARIALARLGNARARAVILRSLGAYSRDARTLAVVAAGRAGLAEARPLLLAMQDDPRRADADAVKEALAALDAE
jgi:HEAT repeat protein